MRSKNERSGRDGAGLLRGVVLLAVIAAAGCSRTEVPTEAALAEVDGEPVTEASFRYWWGKEVPSVDSAEVRRAMVERLIERTAMVQRARRAGLHESAEMVEAVESLLVAKLDELELQPEIAALAVSEAEVVAAYEAEKQERFREPAKVSVAVLWFDTRGQAPLAERYLPRLEKVREIIENEPSGLAVADGFGQIAVANSEHRSSRYKGGRLGWIEDGVAAADRVAAAAVEIASGLGASGDLSEVTVRGEGVFLVRLLGRKKASVRPLGEVRGEIESRLLAAKRAAAREAYRERVMAGLSVERYPERAESLADLPVEAPFMEPSFPTKLSQNSNR